MAMTKSLTKAFWFLDTKHIVEDAKKETIFFLQIFRKRLKAGFKQLMHVQRYSIATMLHVTAEPRGRPFASSMYFY